MAVKANASVTLIRVDDGDSGIIVSATAPTNPDTGQLWQTATGKPIKRWDGSKWVIHYISVENLDVKTLSALSANLGTVTAGTIKSVDETMIIDVTKGTLKSYDDKLTNTAELGSARLKFDGEDEGTVPLMLSIYAGKIFSSRQDTTKGSIEIEFFPSHLEGYGDIRINNIPLIATLTRLDRVVEQVTLNGNGYGWVTVPDKPGYGLAQAYNWGEQFTNHKITAINYNGTSKLYNLFLDKNLATNGSIAVRLIWIKG